LVFESKNEELVMDRLRITMMTGAIIWAMAAAPQAATYLVVNTADSGAGSLRWAIQTANISSGADTIAFAIPGAGPHTIAPTTALPAISDRVYIDGYTQPEAVQNSNPMLTGINAVLQIELNGAGAWTVGANGALDVRAGGTVVRGLAIGRWDIPGIRLAGSGDHAVEGCFIGTNITGTAGRPNTIGIVVESVHNIIGGPDHKDRNLISGNSGEGLYITGDSTIVYGNFIGSDVTGAAALANRNAGIHGDLADYTEIGGSVLQARNLISGNVAGTGGDGDGIWIDGGTGNDVIGNFIGVDITGLSALGNARTGVYIRNSADGWIGGESASYRNVISGNLENGVWLDDGTRGFHVSANYIGCDASGTAAIANLESGVLTWNTDSNMIGGHSAGYGNVISGNFNAGVYLYSTADTVQGNYIGTDHTGTGILWNHVGVFARSMHCVIGKTGGVSPTGEGNIIAFNWTEGVRVINWSGNTIRANSIHSNRELGIDLAGDGVTPNDSGDPDTGPNGLQNFPTLVSADVGWNHTRITGQLQSSPTESYWVDFYAGATCDSSGFGEGETYLGSIAVTTDAVGYAPIDVCFSTLVPDGHYVTAAATGPEGTSEFSNCVEVMMGLIVTNANPSGPGSLANAVANCAACEGADGITFAIPGTGPHTITPAAPLLVGTWDYIDGYSQLGSSKNTNPPGTGTNAVLQVEINLTSSQIVLAEGHSRISGLAINSCPGAAILVLSDSNFVDGCFIGTDPSGTIARPNQTGIRIESSVRNRIGGSIADRLNLISGNTSHGIHLEGEETIVEGNLIGTDPTGAIALGAGNGIYLNDAGKSRIGGTAPGERNVISGGHYVGIYISGNSVWTDVEGNFIGTDITGTVALPNTVGIAIDGGSNNSWVGGAGVGEQNIISGNALGVNISGALTMDNTVSGNFIGSDVDGLPLGNTNAGVRIFEASGNTIGGTAAGRGNNIAFNGTVGVLLDPGTAAADNLILGNAIFDNNGIGIDWGNDGVTANGLPDGYQDFPVLTSVTTAPGSTMISATVSSNLFADVTVQFFDNTRCDASGHGEGAGPIGDTLVTTDALGMAAFTVTLPVGLCAGYVTATATNATETSEFSACLLAVNTPAGVDIVVQPPDDACQSPATLTFSNVTSGGFTSLSYGDSCPDLPAGYLPGNPSTCYEFATTASFKNTVEICIGYDEKGLAGPDRNLRMLYYDTLLIPPDWLDVSSSVDTLKNVICGLSSALGKIMLAVIDPAVGIAEKSFTPSAFALHQNVPNPFNPVTTIRYDVPYDGSQVSIKIYDVAGNAVRTMVDAVQTAGEKKIVWHGLDDRGNQVATGVYFCRMTALGFNRTLKMVLLR
jgi:hypothetical protein